MQFVGPDSNVFKNFQIHIREEARESLYNWSIRGKGVTEVLIILKIM